MKPRLLLPQVASATFAVALFIGTTLLHAESANAASPSRPKDSSADAAPLPQPGPWLLAAGVVALCASNVRWRGKRQGRVSDATV